MGMGTNSARAAKNWPSCSTHIPESSAQVAKQAGCTAGPSAYLQVEASQVDGHLQAAHAISPWQETLLVKQAPTRLVELLAGPSVVGRPVLVSQVLIRPALPKAHVQGS